MVGSMPVLWLAAWRSYGWKHGGPMVGSMAVLWFEAWRSYGWQHGGPTAPSLRPRCVVASEAVAAPAQQLVGGGGHCWSVLLRATGEVTLVRDGVASPGVRWRGQFWSTVGNLLLVGHLLTLLLWSFWPMELTLPSI
jgi:hypothetical protein